MPGKTENPVAVVIPTRDDEPDMLRRSIDSVLGQTYPAVELIVVDDGSQIPFAGIEKEYRGRRIRWIASPVNRGAAASRNLGAGEAASGLLAFLDCGDSWRSAKLERQVALWKKHAGQRLIYSGAGYFKKGRVRHARPRVKGSLYPAILARNLITGSASSVLMDREKFAQVGGFDTSRELPEDHDLWIRLSRRWAWDFVDDCDVNVFVTPGSRSTAVERKKTSYLAIIGKYQQELTEHSLTDKALANYFERIAELYKRQGDHASHARWSLLELTIAPGARNLLRAAVALFEVLSRSNINDFLSFREPPGDSS